MSRPSVLIAAKFAPTGYGGLAQYQRCLARELQNRASVDTKFCAIDGGAHPPPFPEGAAVSLDSGRNVSTSLWMRFASRRPTHPFLETLINRAFAREVRQAMPGGTKAIHFVGTGWDFLGFALREPARQAGASFTIWPAVHPRQWGDDEIDVRLYNQADTVFTQSQYETEHLVSRGVERSKITVCGLPPLCSPDGNREAFRAAHELAGPTVLFVGRRVAQKGFTALLKAWPTVTTRFPNAVILIAGEDAPGADELLATVPRQNLRDLGTPIQETLADAFAACDVFVMPSSDESFGIAYAEAWSYAKPVICGTAPAPREWIQDGTTGLHADQEPNDIAAAIMGLFAQPQVAEEMGRAGLAFQRSHLTPEGMLAKHLAAFKLPPSVE